MTCSGEGNILVARVSNAFGGLSADRSAASAAEYALLLGIVGASLALASFTVVFMRESRLYAPKS